MKAPVKGGKKGENGNPVVIPVAVTVNKGPSLGQNPVQDITELTNIFVIVADVVPATVLDGS